MMASEFAKSIAKAVTKSNYERALLHRGSIRTQSEEIGEAVDAEIQEIRAVLSLTADRRYPDEIHGHCWCRKDLTNDNEPHDEFCQRARALMEKLTCR